MFQETQQSNLLRNSLFGAAAIFLVWVLNGFAAFCFFSTPEARGTFGDAFGSINALFSGLAFLGVIVAIVLQKMELEEQRKEIRQSRIAQQTTADELQQQTFDNTFFQMLTLHHQLLNGIDIAVANGRTDSGRDCFAKFYSRFTSMLANHPYSKRDKSDRDCIEEVYEKLYGQIQNDVGHYFRNLYNIVKFVDRSSAPDKRFYTNLIRAQLSAPELHLVFYNGISMHGRDKFKPLIEKYSLLKNMQLGGLVHETHKDWYSQSAFASSADAA